ICYASKDIVSILNNIKPPYNINTLTQSAALKRLKNLTEIASEIELIKTERALLSSTLKTIHFISKVYPSQANFLLVKMDDAQMRYKQLVEKGIVVRNRSTQFGCENCLRLTVGTPKENQNLINTLKDLQ
ncbi:MAG: aminotransferase class I/II-fold pyridoxal phosphate-dependent enzyme, partial [Xanthomarina gelatinilytica]|nr:aminotransferase class I/II-fold pyridoxal phosphate-dependent enzyme [Xanthomarina gelatinilytica]